MPELRELPEMPKPVEFRYEALLDPQRETRLVLLEPAEDESSEIKITLQPAVIAAAEYEALSYAWGDGTLTLPVLVNGLIFQVTTNLFHALQNLRRKNDARTVWIDAICIDQKNNEEKSQQVGNMMAIYKAATRVVIWLGRYSEPEDMETVYHEQIWGFSSLEPGNLETTKQAFGLIQSVLDEQDVSDVPYQVRRRR